MILNTKYAEEVNGTVVGRYQLICSLRYAQDFRIYSTAEAFLSDFGDDEQAINCANHFKENCNGKDRATGRRQIR